MLEKQFSKKVVEYLKSLDDTFIIKVEGLMNGTSDLIVCHKGKFVAIELKGSGSSYDATPGQLLFLKKVRNAGGISFVLKHSDYWKIELDRFLEGSKIYEIKSAL